MILKRKTTNVFLLFLSTRVQKMRNIHFFYFDEKVSNYNSLIHSNDDNEMLFLFFDMWAHVNVIHEKQTHTHTHISLIHSSYRYVIREFSLNVID